jgi:uncharacterized protein (TIGR03083 family)
MSQASEILAALKRSHELLAATVAPLDAAGLRAQSYDRDWIVAQVLSHLGSGAVIGKLNLDAALAGTPAPTIDDFRAVWAVWDGRTPEEQGAGVLPADEALIEAFDSAVDRLPELQLPLGPMKLDGVSIARMRLNEHALHTWDVRVSFDPTVTVDQTAVGPLLDGVGALLGFLGKPTGTKATVRVTLTDPARDLALTLGDAVSLAPWEGGDADATLTAPAEAFLRLTYGRLDPDHTPAGVATTGSVDLDVLRKTFPGF